MEAVISGIKRMEIHDGDGLRTTVFFKGCSLKCVWCHNPESIFKKPALAFFKEKCVGCGSCFSVCKTGAIRFGSEADEKGGRIDREKCVYCMECEKECPTGALKSFGKKYTVEALYDAVIPDRPFFEATGGGVTLSGGECLMQGEFAAAFAKKLHENGISVDVDTCGFVPGETFEKILPFTDTFLYDVKAVDPEVHRACTGQDNALILENLRFLNDRGARIEVRYPLVCGRNDGECEKIAKLLSSLPSVTGVKVLRYHNFAASRYEALGMENTLPEPKTTEEDVEKAREVFRKHGINVME